MTITIGWPGALRRGVLLSLLAFFAQFAHAQLQSGDAAPRLDIELLDGQTLPAQALQDKVVVTMFWATWCPYCVAELPKMQTLHRSLGAQGLEIIAISLDKGRDEVVDFWKQNGYTFPVAMRSPALRAEYGAISGTPTFFVTDRKGIVQLRRIGGFDEGELEALVKKLL